MKKLFLFILLISQLSSFGQLSDNSILIGTRDTIMSSVLGEERSYWVYLPSSYRTKQSHRRFPVVYLLDADVHFHSVTGLLHQFTSGVNGNDLFPEMIVVGILNTNRTRDLTPSQVQSDNNGNLAFQYKTGGAASFLSFLNNELIPKIDRQYYTTPYRMLVGHSFGGLFVLNTLLNRPEQFTSFLAIDPSVSWDNAYLLKDAEKLLQAKDFSGKRLFIGIANTMPPGITFRNVSRDSSANTFHIRSIKKFIALLQKATVKKTLKSSWEYYENEDHGSVPLIATYNALHFFFDGYRMSQPIALGGVDLISKHFKAVSQLMGYDILPPETRINQIGYYLLRSGQVDKALEYFAFNTRNYPNSANAFDSMADGYLKKGETKKAKECFEKAIELDPENQIYKKKLSDIISK